MWRLRVVCKGDVHKWESLQYRHSGHVRWLARDDACLGLAAVCRLERPFASACGVYFVFRHTSRGRSVAPSA